MFPPGLREVLVALELLGVVLVKRESSRPASFRRLGDPSPKPSSRNPLGLGFRVL